MMLYGMDRDLVEAVDKCRKRVRAVYRRQHYGVGRAEIKRFMRRTRPAFVVQMQELVEYFYHAPAQPFYRGKFPDVHPRKLLRQCRLVARKEAPVREVIGKPLADEVMFLQRTKRMLKN